MTLASKTAAGFATLEIVLAWLSAALIVADTPQEPEAVFLWLYLMAATFPVSLLLAPMTSLTDNLPPVSFLPGIAGNWPNLLAPLIFFCTIGAAWWWLLGYGFSRLCWSHRQPPTP